MSQLKSNSLSSQASSPTKSLPLNLIGTMLKTQSHSELTPPKRSVLSERKLEREPFSD